MVSQIGNTYSGAVPLGLSAILDEAKPGDRIFAVAYGSGAGSDAFDITVTDEMAGFQRQKAPTVKELMSKHEVPGLRDLCEVQGQDTPGR